MAKTRAWTCLSLLSLMLPFWSSLLLVDGHGVHTQSSGSQRIEYVDEEEVDKVPVKPFRDARLYIEARYRRPNGEITLRAYMCIQQPGPVTIYCFELSPAELHDAYRKANFYFVSGVHKRPAWGIYRQDRRRWVPFDLPSQFMLGIHPQDKLVNVFIGICDDVNVHKVQSNYLLELGLLPKEQFDRFIDYFCINDLNIFRTSFREHALPCHSAYVIAVRNTMRAFSHHMRAQRKMDEAIARQWTWTRRQHASTDLQSYSSKTILTWEDLRWAMLYLMEKMIDPCIVVEGDGHGTFPIEGFNDNAANRLCGLFCKAIGITATLRSRDPEYKYNNRWQICAKFTSRGECRREETYGRCWCDFEHDDGLEYIELLTWCHNHIRTK